MSNPVDRAVGPEEPPSYSSNWQRDAAREAKRTSASAAFGTFAYNGLLPVLPAERSLTGALDCAALLRRRDDLIATCDLAAARRALQHIAEAGEAGANLALGRTDPAAEFEKLPVHGLTPNIAMARSWYESARQLASVHTRQRLEMLASKRE